MIIAHHLIWTGYGWWLPNDPRGSMSREIRVERVAELGPAHYGRKRVQPPSRAVGAFYRDAGDILKNPLLTLDEQDVSVVARAFSEVIRIRCYTCYACAIMPDHVHLVIRKTSRQRRRNDYAPSECQCRHTDWRRATTARPSRLGRTRLEGVSRLTVRCGANV